MRCEAFIGRGDSCTNIKWALDNILDSCRLICLREAKKLLSRININFKYVPILMITGDFLAKKGALMHEKFRGHLLPSLNEVLLVCIFPWFSFDLVVFLLWCGFPCEEPLVVSILLCSFHFHLINLCLLAI